MLGRVVSAQDEFRGFLRDLVSPAMRSAGLRGSAVRYYMPSLSCFALVGFQKSTWSTGSAVNFHDEPQGGEPRGMEARPGGPDLASGDACPKHPLSSRGMVAADRQPHARRKRSLVVAAAGTATGAAWLLRWSELSQTMACQPSSAPSGKHHEGIAGAAVRMELGARPAARSGHRRGLAGQVPCWGTGSGQLVQAPVRPARGRAGRCDGQQNPSLRRQCPQMLIVVQHGHPVLFPDSTESG